MGLGQLFPDRRGALEGASQLFVRFPGGLREDIATGGEKFLKGKALVDRFLGVPSKIAEFGVAFWDGTDGPGRERFRASK